MFTLKYIYNIKWIPTWYWFRIFDAFISVTCSVIISILINFQNTKKKKFITAGYKKK